MATFELYLRSTTIGKCLTETLDEMVSGGALIPELATKVLVQFDKVMTEILETQDSIKANDDDDGVLRDIVVAGGHKNQVFPSRSPVYPDECTGTTIVAIRGDDFVLFATDGRRTERMFGLVLNDDQVKTWWLTEYIFAICAGKLSVIEKITRMIKNHYLAHSVDSVEEVAEKIREKADELASEQKCSFFVVGRRRRVILQETRVDGLVTERAAYNEIPRLFHVVKDEGAPCYEIKVVDEAVGGSGRRYAQTYLDDNRQKLDNFLRNRDISAIKDIIKSSIARARRDDVFTDGAINMITITSHNTPLIERAVPLFPANLRSAYSDWIYTFQPHYVPEKLASTFQDYTF